MNTKRRRSFQLAALAVTTFAATMTAKAPEAKAVVYCAAGVYRAGCVVAPVMVAPVVRPTVYGVARRSARRTTRRVMRRSDMRLKHDIVLLGHLSDGLGFYRFTYNGEDKPFVGVMAQEVQTVLPQAVIRGSDGYLRVSYDDVGVKFQSYDQWIMSGSHVPLGAPVPR